MNWNFELKSLIHRYFIDQESAARDLPMAPIRLSRLIRGVTIPTQADIDKIAALLARKIFLLKEANESRVKIVAEPSFIVRDHNQKGEEFGYRSFRQSEADWKLCVKAAGALRLSQSEFIRVAIREKAAKLFEERKSKTTDGTKVKPAA